MSAPRRLPKHGRDIGPEVLAARRGKVPWKTLEDRYGLSRRWMLTLMRQAQEREALTAMKMGSSHLRAGHGAGLLG